MSASQLLNAESVVENDDGDEQTTFEDADADPKTLRFRHINLCRKLEGKQKQLEKQHEAAEEQKNEMAKQQAKLVELQAVAKGIIEQIKELQCQSASIALQIARIEEERRQVREATIVPSPDPACPPEVQAVECLTKAAAALQGFQSQSPNVQLLLQQFISFVDQLRAGDAVATVADTKQTTLQQAFANACAAIPGGNAGAEKASPIAAHPTVQASVPFFDISSSQPSEGQPIAPSSVAEAAPASMEVVGECSGDKRKSDCLREDEPIAAGKKNLVDQPAGQEGEQQLGTPMSLLHVPLPEYVPQTREELLESLALRNKKQCEDRKARTEAQHQKSCPY